VNAAFRQSGKKAGGQEFRLEKSGGALDSADSGGNVRLKLQDATSQTYSQFQVSPNMVALVEKQFQLLITDDNPSFRSVLREVLEDRPFLVLHEAESGEEALEVVQSRRIDIVLLDMHMRFLTGIETLRAMKQLDIVRPCILITSDTSEDVCRDAQDAQAFTVLKKPVPRRQLVETVATALTTAYDLAAI
jgi:two-component system, response regulator PdtaR